MANKVEFQWFGPQVQRGISRGMAGRVKRAASYLRRRVVKNISIPVVRFQTSMPGGTFTWVIRSKPGEFPRTDTARLRRDIFWEMIGPHEAAVGTTIDYGAILEFSMRRSFLRRTLREEQKWIMHILVHGPPKLPGQMRRGRT
jgi:hypothetical protein